MSAAQSASALGWARADQAAVLGRPLSFSATLRLDPGDQISPECVRAEVMSGDRVLPASLVHVHADVVAEALAMRVATEPTIDEPVVTVTLAIGCPTRLSRRFVLFADPAPVATPTMAAAVPQSRPVDLPAPAAAPSQPPSPVASPASTAPARAEPRRRAPPAEAAAPRPRPAAPARSSVATPRLKLDPVESLPSRAQATAEAASAVQDAIAAVSRAASAAEAAASSASAAEARVATLEQTVKQLRADAEQSRQLVSDLRRQLAEAREDNWRLPLILTIAALLALAGGLWWRLRALQQERQQAWQRAAAAEPPPRPPMPTLQLPLMTSEIPMPPPAPVPPRPAVVAPTPGPEVHEIHSERTQILPTGSRADESQPRDVTIEELLDLEQQAEFFIVLGQDDAAIDLLVEHLRDTGGGSPLPYLKLLEIYRRRGEREAYERTRERFNRRFNAYAPEWEADLQHGRSLDEYPGVLPRLQQVWAKPLDAMAELEALLFRKSRGELFDLPAYREVLFLYSLARDLLDREAVESGTVDLLLPLAEESDFGMTSPHPYLTLERESVFDPGIAEPPPVAAIDLDLDLSELQPEADAGPPTAPDAGPGLIPPRR
ncbi:MAG: hypothetical protein QM702_04750 [Rubrivivax sp.]